MVRVATVTDPFEAKLLAARLGSEGFLWEIRGDIDGVYPIGPFDVLVEEPSVADVRDLLADRSDPDPDDFEQTEPVGPSRGWLLTAVIFAIAIGFLIMRTLALA